MNTEYWRWPETSWVSPIINWEKADVITAGVDVGAVSSQAAVICDGEVYAYSNIRTGSNSRDSAQKAMDRALEGTRMKIKDIDYIVGTGYGRFNVPSADRAMTEIDCHARGTKHMYGSSPLPP